MRRAIPVLVVTVLAGCGTSIFSVRVPLVEKPQAVSTRAANITIEDKRAPSELKVHTGGGLFSCQRWYGDDTYVPPKLVYLDQLLADRVPQGASVRIELKRFDTIEFCDNTANKAGAAAAAGASGATGTPIYVAPTDTPGGDSVLVRLTGTINGVPFNLSRSFDYSDLPYAFGNMPASNPQYRERLRLAMASIADELASKIPATTSENSR